MWWPFCRAQCRLATSPKLLRKSDRSWRVGWRNRKIKPGNHNHFGPVLQVRGSTKMSVMIRGGTEINNEATRTSRPEEEIFKVVCRMCHGGCGTLVHRQDGRITKV